jgi:hypothetical protein
MSRWFLAMPLLAVVACTPDYPMDRPGTWSVGTYGSNDANLRAMVVAPRDLAIGRGERTSLGPEAVRPVDRLYAGRRTQLPTAGSASSVYAVPVAGGTGGDSAGGQQ